MHLEHTYARTFPTLAVAASPTIPTTTRLSWLNEPLAHQLGLDPTWLASDRGLNWLTGGSNPTYALAYSGYQFGQLSPRLGDGRAHLIGERQKEDGSGYLDLHLKGSGRTPFSRPGTDGKAPLTACWREAVIGEALHGMGLPTSRALAVLETGERILRRGPEPAGIVVRAAESHLRVGTFQYAHMSMNTDQRQVLVDYALDRHPGGSVGNRELGPSGRARQLLADLIDRQVQLTARFLGLGFVHGVLNTDNVTVSGQAIDFGPCAFIDTMRRDAVFSSIDRAGRYAYNQQMPVTRWNLARFAESLLDLLDEEPNRAIEAANGLLSRAEELSGAEHTAVFAQKLGLDVEGGSAELMNSVADFIEDTLDVLEAEWRDFTAFFRVLTEGGFGGASGQLPGASPELLAAAGGLSARLEAWMMGLEGLRAATATGRGRADQLMRSANPVYVPRNLHLERALAAVAEGDTSPVVEVLEAVRNPLVRQAHLSHLELAPPSSVPFVTYCGT